MVDWKKYITKKVSFQSEQSKRNNEKEKVDKQKERARVQS